MSVLSALSYFLTRHSFLAFPLIVILFGILGIFISVWKKKGGLLLFVLGFLFALLNIFISPIWNALLLNAYGITGSGVIVHSKEMNIMENERIIREYDVVLRTAGGHDVTTTIDDTSISFYPIHNTSLIPAQGQRFVTKYIPGFEENFVIMIDQSEYGKAWLAQKDLEPVQEAEAKLAASPQNPAFIEEYRVALQTFINKHRNDADPILTQDCQQKLDALNAAAK